MPNFRGLNIPFTSFGNVTSNDLFSDKEQAIFNFYEASKTRYRRALDVGANIGVHSILMAKQGWCVLAYEPDPLTYAHFRRNVDTHEVMVGSSCAAVSDHQGDEVFVRVKGNMTGSHLKGDKSPYGELEEIPVHVVDCRPLFKWADFAKIDCEGHEAKLLLTVTDEACEFMVEVGSQDNAKAIYEHFQGKRGMWAQKLDWKPVRSLEDVPKHHSEGGLFIGRKGPFP